MQCHRLGLCTCTCAIGVLICSAVYFSMLGDIPSTPGDKFSFILLILLATTSALTTNCPKLSPSCSSSENYDEIITIMKIYLMLR